MYMYNPTAKLPHNKCIYLSILNIIMCLFYHHLFLRSSSDPNFHFHQLAAEAFNVVDVVFTAYYE